MGLWEKLGLIYSPKGTLDWSVSHATVPTALHLKDDLYRVYFSTRNKINHNQVGSIELDISNPDITLREAQEPCLRTGPTGHFDCDGVYGTSVVTTKEGLLMYYAGWNAGQRGLFYSNIGLAKSLDGGLTFQRVSSAPILGRDEIDPWMCAAPFVLREKPNDWLMWYISGLKIETSGSEIESRYHIKTARSKDGYAWIKTGQTAIELEDNETNIARVSAVKVSQGYKFWYPYVSNAVKAYRIGHGFSEDGETVTRNDSSVGITTSKSGWDSEAITYPHVFLHKEYYYMLYNGNEYGRDGFGLARCPRSCIEDHSC